MLSRPVKDIPVIQYSGAVNESTGFTNKTDHARLSNTEHHRLRCAQQFTDNGNSIDRQAQIYRNSTDKRIIHAKVYPAVQRD
jgi:hypothetical protein